MYLYDSLIVRSVGDPISPRSVVRMKSESEYISHYGIPGQKWGVRRFQNEDGTLTAEGRERYDIADPKEATREVTNAYNRYLRARKSKKATPEKKLMTKAEWLYKADKNYDVSIRKQINREIDKKVDISKRRLELEKAFLAKGMSQKEAQISAVKRERVEKVLKIAGAATLAVALAYAGTKVIPYINRVRDQKIPRNSVLQNLSTDAQKTLDNPFYAVYKNKDKMHYLGYFGGQHLRGNRGVDVYKMTAQAGKGMRVASERTGKKALTSLLKDDKDFRLALEDTINGDWKNYSFNNQFLAKPGEHDYLLGRLRNGKANRKLYDAVNTMLTSHGTSNQIMNDKFYTKLKKMGYDAIIDVNDKYNVYRYRGTNPLIVFNPAKLIDKKNELIPTETMRTMVKYANQRVHNVDISRAAKNTVGVYIKTYGMATLSGLGFAGLVVSTNKADKKATYRKVVALYKKEHPDTKLTDSEILENELGQKRSKHK